MTLNVIFFSLFVVIESFFLFFNLAYIYSFIPLHWTTDLPKGLEPERESFLYSFFILILIVVLMAALKWLWPRWNTTKEQDIWRKRLWVDIILVGLLVILFAKAIINAYPFYPILKATESGAWIKPAMAVTLLWMWLLKWRWFSSWPAFKFNLRIFNSRLSIAVVWVILGILIFPSMDVLEPLSFFGDGFQSIDRWPMSQWMLSWGLNYAQTMTGLVFLTWIFIGAVGLFIWQWLKNVGLSILGMCMVLTIGFFNYAQTPCPWIYPQTTVLASLLDIVSLWCWFIFIQRETKARLILAVICSVVAFALSVMLHPWISMPFYKSLQVRQFWSFSMMFFLAFSFTSLFLISMYHLKIYKDRGWIILLMIALGGLFNLSFVLLAPKPGAYAWCALQLSLLSIYLLSLVIKRIAVLSQHIVMICMILGIVMLVQNRIFLASPHVIKNSNTTALKENYLRNDWDGLANMMLSYDREHSSIAIISPFENKFSQITKRKLFFNSDLRKRFDQIVDGPCYIFIYKPWLNNQNIFFETIQRHYQPLASQPDGVMSVWQNNKEGCH